ncbi:hypothetical protein AB7M15_005608 [Bradyrhizobium ottawaense]
MQFELGIDVAHRGFARGDVGFGLVERRLEVTIVDLGQRLAGLHLFVVTDQHLGDVAGDFWRDDRGVGLHIGVVGCLEVAAVGPVVVPVIDSGCRAREERERQRRAPHPVPERDSRRRLGAIGGDFSCLLKNLGAGHLGHGSLLSAYRDYWSFWAG